MGIRCIRKYVDDIGDEHLTSKDANNANRAIEMAKTLASNTSLEHRQAREVADFIIANYFVGKLNKKVDQQNLRPKAYNRPASALAEYGS